MADTPKRGGPVLLGATPISIYNASGSATYAVLRLIHVTNETAGTVTVSIGITKSGNLTDNIGKRLWTNTSLTVGQWLDWSGFLPLATPDQLYALCSPAAGATITTSVVEGP